VRAANKPLPVLARPLGRPRNGATSINTVLALNADFLLPRWHLLGLSGPALPIQPAEVERWEVTGGKLLVSLAEWAVG
jgi:hypothetical protein